MKNCFLLPSKYRCFIITYLVCVCVCVCVAAKFYGDLTIKLTGVRLSILQASLHT